ncbi:MAG: Zn-ribbon domain-containing OB-fold protein [Syntrophobacterales bacterium]|nr:Zn-ribbon domain-containing OB-fold protein [Syntrophobacterales bacterium]
MVKEYRTIQGNVTLPYQWAPGKTWNRFFDGLKDEKILGTKCADCGRVYVPARTFCPSCLSYMTQWVEVKPEGSILSWTLVRASYYGQVKEPPYVVALIRLDGSDCGFSHFVGGLDLSDPEQLKRKLKTGTKVKAVWRADKKADIYDIAYFAPVK